MYYLIHAIRILFLPLFLPRADIFYRDMNRLVMDYLVTEGYKAAAEEFCKEADLTPSVDLQSISDRMNIREALQRGDVEEAITRVNDLNPEVCMRQSLQFVRMLHT